jgi:hypothetical protein
MEYTRWLPGRRTDQLNMAKIWCEVFQTKGSAWSIPADVITEFDGITITAERVLAVALSSERTKLITADCSNTFGEMVSQMRFIKKHWLLQPPLTDADMLSLLLHLHDDTKTPILAPHLEAEATIRYLDSGIIEVAKIRPRGDMTHEDKRAYAGVRIYFGLTGTPTSFDLFRLTEAPAGGYQLPHSIWTQRHSHRFEFPGESGNKAFFSLRYENGTGHPGPWGPVITVIIP